MNTVQHYFKLQLTRLKRQLIEFGINPVLGAVLIAAGFYGFSFYLFTKTTYANYLYCLIALNTVVPYSEKSRNHFLKFTYAASRYLQIRITENILTILPFIVFLCFKQDWYVALLLLVLSVIFCFINTGKIEPSAIPTPFYKKPFEFIVGFRKYLAGFVFAFFVTIMSVVYQNFNLGIFSLILVFLLCMTFYFEAENEFYVWVHQLNVNRFLLDKISTAVLFATLLSLPVAISLLIFFPTNFTSILIFQGAGYCYLITMILAKYSAYPKAMHLPQGILLALCISFPPLLAAAVPLFYLQSRKRLKAILE